MDITVPLSPATFDSTLARYPIGEWAVLRMD